MEVLTTSEAMIAWADARRARGEHIGLVPTMGFLHEGHTSLMDQLRPRCDALVVSIFVNPLQFGEGEDLSRYPRDPEGDLCACRAHGVDAVFLPDNLYPEGFVTRVRVEKLTAHLCGASRPVHFEGVATVVARLFGLTRCASAIFGDKDFQQLTVVRRMAHDLALPVEVIGAPLVRDADGVALSSRNAYLSAEERVRARSIHRALFALREALEAGERGPEALVAKARLLLDVDAVDYLEIVDVDDLQPLIDVDRPARAVIAAYVGRTRLLDNVALEP